MAVLVCLWNAVFSQLEAGDPVSGRGTYPAAQRPSGKSRAAGDSRSASRAQSPESVSATTVFEKQPILISAQFGSDWQPGAASGRVHLLRGNVLVEQGPNRVKARQGAIWVQSLGPNSTRQRVRLYMEGDVGVVQEQSTRTTQAFSGEWITSGDLSFDVVRSEHANQDQDPVFMRAWERWTKGPDRKTADANSTRLDPAVHQAHGTEILTDLRDPGANLGTNPGVDKLAFGQPVEAKPAGERRLRFFSRSQTPFNLWSSEVPNTNPVQQIMVITGGVTCIIDGVEEAGTVDMRADHMVVWTQAVDSFDEQATETKATSW
jgi:hypothetical protein